MDSAQRHELILRLLRQQERADVAELAELTGCSEMTVRRDLDTLERDGLLRRVRGAAVSMLAGEATPFSMRSRQQVDAKRRIGAAVAALLDDGESVLMDGGTTVLEVARASVGRRLTVMPLSLHSAGALAAAEHIRLVLPGGELIGSEQVMSGPLTAHALDRTRFDTAVIGCCGISAKDGITAHDLAEAEIKLAAVRGSARVIAAADSSKLGCRAFARVCDLGEVNLVVTDVSARADQLDGLRDAGVEVHCV